VVEAGFEREGLRRGYHRILLGRELLKKKKKDKYIYYAGIIRYKYRKKATFAGEN